MNTPERHSEFVDFQMAAKRILNIKSGNTFEFELSETVDGTMRYDSAVLFITHDVNTYYVKNSGIKGGGYLFACSESTVNDNLIDEIILICDKDYADVPAGQPLNNLVRMYTYPRGSGFNLDSYTNTRYGGSYMITFEVPPLKEETFNFSLTYHMTNGTKLVQAVDGMRIKP